MKKYSLHLIFLSAALFVALCGGALAACDNTGAHEHVFGEWVEVTAPGCEENGLKKHVCTVSGCGYEETEDIPALDHAWGTSKVTKAATCTEAGERTRECSRCHKTESTPTEKLEHEWVTDSVEKAATCTETGEEKQSCAVCGATRDAEIPELGHDWDVPEIVKPATCTEAGVERKTCKRCHTPSEDEEIPALEHQWVRTRVIRAATCTEAGEEEQTCSRPNCPVKTQTVEIPALDHAWQNYFTVDRQPTFETAGSKSHHCNRCEETKDETEIPKLDVNTPISYEFRTLRGNGELLIDPSVVIAVKDETGREVARSSRATLAGGVFTADLLPKTYTVTVENTPDGYTCGESFTVTPFDPYCNVYLTATLRQGTPTGQYKTGDVMFDFTVSAASSTVGELSLGGILETKKMVLLNFWFVGCTYCEQEFPYLQRAYARYKDTVEVLGVNCPQTGQTGSMSEITGYAREQGLTFPLVQNGVLRLAAAFGVTGYPTSVVIDGEGVVREILIGPQSQTEFERIFAKYSAEDFSAHRESASALSPAALLPARRRDETD